jgi:hypothetical protein
MSIKKQFLKSKPICKVTFRIHEEVGNSAKTAHLVGEFNSWNFLSTPMKNLKMAHLRRLWIWNTDEKINFVTFWIKRIGQMIRMPTDSFQHLMETVRIQS